MKTNPIRSPQHGPAVALVELLTEHPELPALDWSLRPNGNLTGYLYDLPNLDAVVRDFMAVLGGTTLPSEHTTDMGARWFAVQIFATWRDVEVHITLGSVARHVVQPSQVVLGREVAA